MPKEFKEICPATAGSCRCGLLEDHDGPHECSEFERCHGSWTGTENEGNFMVIRWPIPRMPI